MASDYHQVDRASSESHEAVSKLSDMLREYAINNRFIIILDTTLASEYSITLAEQFRKEGYNVKLQIVATDQHISDQSVYKRYLAAMDDKKPSRMVGTHFRDPAYEKLPSMIDRIHDRGFTDIKINVRYFDGRNETIYDGPKKRRPSEALIEGRTLSYQRINVDEHLANWDRIIDGLNQKNADPERIERAIALSKKDTDFLKSDRLNKMPDNDLNPGSIDKHLYKIRHLVENAFARIKHYRAIAIRYDKLEICFRSTIAIAFIMMWLPMYV